MNTTSVLLDVLLLIASVTGARSAGVYLAVQVMVLPSLRGGDPVEAVRTMRRVNETAMRPVFLSVFFGAGLAAVGLVVVAVVTNGGVHPLQLVGAALLNASVLLTILVNVPRNNARARADASTSAWTASDRVWSRANAVRCCLSALGAALLTSSVLL
ncbi:DUF1772 domain-containing protein [Microbacteriaceae bacterium VKM Ac-2855]|nr:DUF1772 domain-containing protein [Microbacteriaceae bacterium VKM Ac-2855]